MFTAGNVAGTATVVATSNAVSTLFDKVVVTVNESAQGNTSPKVESVTITSSEGTTEVEQSGTLNLSATVLPDEVENKDVSWSIKSGATATDSTVTAQGVFNAGEVLGKAVVVATSDEDNAVFGELEITVKAIKYLVTFMDYESHVIGTQYVERGGTASEPEETPVKVGQQAVWSRALSDITSETVIYLENYAWIDNYTVKYLDRNGDLIGSAQECEGAEEGNDITPVDGTEYENDDDVFEEWKTAKEGTVFTLTPIFVSAVKISFYDYDIIGDQVANSPIEGFNNKKIKTGTKLSEVKPAELANTETHNFAGWAIKDGDNTVLANNYAINEEADFVAVYKVAQFITFGAKDGREELKLRFGIGYKGVAVDYTGVIRNGSNPSQIYDAAIFTYDYFFGPGRTRTENPFDTTNLSAGSNAFAVIVDTQNKIRVVYGVTDGIWIRGQEKVSTTDYNNYMISGANRVEDVIQPGEYLIVGVNNGSLRAVTDNKLWRGGKAEKTLDTEVTLTGIELHFEADMDIGMQNASTFSSSVDRAVADNKKSYMIG